jgi:MFS superfamily sulfate permease-like transporter
MLAAIGIILILKQFPHAVGYDVDYMGDDAFIEKSGKNTFEQLLNAFQFIHPGAVLVSVMSLGIMLGWDKGASKGYRFFQLLPGALMAILSAVVVNSLFQSFFPSILLLLSECYHAPFLLLEEFYCYLLAGFAFLFLHFLPTVKRF